MIWHSKSVFESLGAVKLTGTNRSVLMWKGDFLTQSISALVFRGGALNDVFYSNHRVVVPDCARRRFLTNSSVAKQLLAGEREL